MLQNKGWAGYINFQTNPPCTTSRSKDWVSLLRTRFWRIIYKLYRKLCSENMWTIFAVAVAFSILPKINVYTAVFSFLGLSVKLVLRVFKKNVPVILTP